MTRISQPGELFKPIKAADVLALLAKRHAEDVFVPECKDGPTWGTSHMRLDAWAMRRSWSKPLVTGYEIKVSRSDFLGDDKWPGYLPCCNCLYFVCPSGVIRPEEVGEPCGLIYALPDRLTVKKKAPYRDVEIPEPIWRYIVMSRSRIIKSSREFEPKPSVERWREWLANKTEKRFLGYEVSRAIRDHVDEVEATNRRLEQKMNDYDDVRTALVELGWKEPDKERWLNGNAAKNKISELKRIFPKDTMRALEAAEIALKSIREEVAKQTSAP